MTLPTGPLQALYERSRPEMGLFTLVSVRPLTGTIESYDAPATEEIARRVGLPVAEIVRFDGNTSPQALP